MLVRICAALDMEMGFSAAQDLLCGLALMAPVLMITRHTLSLVPSFSNLFPLVPRRAGDGQMLTLRMKDCRFAASRSETICFDCFEI